jgi:hypothetical protein
LKTSYWKASTRSWDLFLKALLIMLGAAVIDRLTAAEVKGAD